MRQSWLALVVVTAITVVALRAAPPAGRPDLAAAKPLVTCQLQALAEKPKQMTEPPAVVMYGRRPVDDSLANYQRTSLGDWPMLADAERNDPWLRVVLLSRKRPVVIDLVILIDGKSFREKREAWSDELMASTKPSTKPDVANKPAAKDAEPQNGASKEAPAKDAAADAGNNKADSEGTKPTAAASEGETALWQRAPPTDEGSPTCRACAAVQQLLAPPWDAQQPVLPQVQGESGSRPRQKTRVAVIMPRWRCRSRGRSASPRAGSLSDLRPRHGTDSLGRRPARRTTAARARVPARG